MSTIKKSFVDIVKYLESNKNSKVEDLLPTIINMTQSQKREVTFWCDEDEVVQIIFCYYHKRWELISEHDYGTKKHSTTGLNTMCKVGVNAWTKQQRDAKAAETQLLEDVVAHKVLPEEIIELKNEIETVRKTIIPNEEAYSYDTVEEAIEEFNTER